MDERVVREALLPAAREEVWEAITRADRLAEWFGGLVEIDPVARGRVEHRAADGSIWRGTVVSEDRPVRLAFWWQACEEGEDPDPAREGGTRVEFVLLEDPDGTLLTITETPSPWPFPDSAGSAGPSLLLLHR